MAEHSMGEHSRRVSSRREFLMRSGVAAGVLGVGISREARRVAPSPRRSAVSEYLSAQMEKYGIPGMTFAVLRRGKLVEAGAMGRASIELDVPMTGTSMLQIASVSKIVAGIAASLLCEDRRLTLETPVSQLLPETPPQWAAVRVHHLLDHTSGLPRPAQHPAYADQERARQQREQYVGEEKLDLFTSDELLGFLRELPLERDPGTKWAYSQTGYMVFGEIVRAVTGERYAEFVRRRVLAPLRMTDSAFGDSRVVIPGRPPVAYSRQYGPLQHWLWPYRTTDYPAAGLNSTALDLAKLFLAIDGGRLLTSRSLDRMWTAVRLADGTAAKYGIGWSVYELDGRRAVGHEGGGCCWLTHLPDARVTAIVLSNLAGARADETADAVARMMV